MEQLAVSSDATPDLTMNQMEENQALKRKKLIELKQALGLTCKQMAKEIGFSRKHLHFVLKGDYKVSPLMVQKVCQTYELPSDYFDTDASLPDDLFARRAGSTPAERIIASRKRRGMTQGALSILAFTSFIPDIERGRRELDRSTARAIGEVLHVDPDWLMYGSSGVTESSHDNTQEIL